MSDFLHDSIPSASRRLAMSFLKHRNGAKESVEVFTDDDLLDVPNGCSVVVTVRLVQAAGMTNDVKMRAYFQEAVPV